MKLHSYQQALLDKISGGGFKHGEMTLFSGGRQMGKSTINQYINQWQDMQDIQEPKHEIIVSAEVDGEPWHTIKCKPEISKWIRTHTDSWYEHIDARWYLHRNMFDISEELYMLLVLKFGR
jgi:predicted ATP-dependent serine protease